jgi:poly(A) polymerase
MFGIDFKALENLKNAYLVGGAVRDFLMGQEPVDYDIATGSDPEALALEIAQRLDGHAIRLGKNDQPLHRVLTRSGEIDITPLQGDTIEADLGQRDLTLNAMAYDPATGRVIDPHGGRNDIAAGTIRMVSPQAFIRDPVRLLRAYRIAAQYRFQIEKRTTAAITACAHHITQSAAERVSAEFRKLFMRHTACPYLADMARSGLLFAIIPELKPLTTIPPGEKSDSTRFEHCLATFKNLEFLLESCKSRFPGHHESIEVCANAEKAVALKWALLLHETGGDTPPTETGAAAIPENEVVSARNADRIAGRLKFSRRDRQYITSIILNYLHPFELYAASVARKSENPEQARFFMQAGDLTPDIILFSLAHSPDSKAAQETVSFESFATTLMDRFYWEYLPLKRKPPLITGRDLVSELGLRPSPQFKLWLQKVEEARLSGGICSRSEALALIKAWLIEA